MKKLYTIFVMALTAQAIFAYPITPQTLRRLIERSQCIVVATVDNPEKIEKYYDEKRKDTLSFFSFRGDGLADLYIKEVLKGKPSNSNHIQVTYEPTMICPQPAHYPDKKVVIAFLAKNDTGDTYHTVGLSYGSKIMDSEIELNSFKTRIIEYITILKNKRKKAIVEWLIKCAEDKYTRWEGAYELSREGYFMSSYDRSKDQQFYRQLTNSQLHRLDSAFFATDTVGYNELCLANLVLKENYSKLKDHLLRSLEYSDYYIANDIMRKILEIHPNSELKNIFDEAYNLSYDDKERDVKQRQLIDKFILVAKQ